MNNGEEIEFRRETFQENLAIKKNKNKSYCCSILRAGQVRDTRGKTTGNKQVCISDCAGNFSVAVPRDAWTKHGGEHAASDNLR